MGGANEHNDPALDTPSGKTGYQVTANETCSSGYQDRLLDGEVAHLPPPYPTNPNRLRFHRWPWLQQRKQQLVALEAH
jgi:hypothetical protein